METLNTLMEISIYAVVIAVATMMLKKCVGRRMSPLLHYAVWTVLVFRLLLPVTFASPVKLFIIPQQEAESIVQQEEPQAQEPVTTAETQSEATGAKVPQAAIDIPAAQAEEVTSGVAASVPERIPHSISWDQIILIVWLAGMGACLAYLIAAAAILHRRVRACGTPPSKRLTALLAEVKAEMGVKANIRLVCMYEYGTPALMAPRTLLMPADALIAMDDEQARLALRHELAHYRRGDHIVNVLLSILNCVYWFNPVVWFAFRQVRADMETACDGAVVKCLDASGRSRYASLVVRLFAQPAHRPLMLGIARENTKRMAEKRVQGIFLKGKSRASVKLIAAALAALLLLTCFTTACQPTPEEEIIVNKNDGVLESAIAATPAPTAHYDAPETWGMGPIEVNSKLTASIDARVEVPDTGAFPVYEFVSGRFTQEQVDRIIEYFFGDATLYEASQPLTKAQLEERLVQARLAYQEALDGATNETGNTKWEDTPEDMLAGIEALEAQIANAPETNETQVSNGQLKLEQYDAYRYETLYVTTDMSRKNEQYLNVSNVVEGKGATIMRLITGNRYYPVGENTVNSQAQGIETTPEEAKRIVQDMLDNLGFDCMEAVTVEAGLEIESEDEVRDDLTGGYRVTCMRRAGDFLVTTMSDGVDNSQDDGSLTAEEEKERYAYEWPPEELYVYVDDTGVTAIEWHGYGVIASTISENVTLLPFEGMGPLYANAISAKVLLDGGRRRGA